jgi:hypothetical protein
VAYRTRRAFRAQFNLLLISSRLQQAEARLEAERDVGNPLRAWRARRDVERLTHALEAARRTLTGREIVTEDGQSIRLGQLADGDRLASVSSHVPLRPVEHGPPPPARDARPPKRALVLVVAFAGLAAFAAAVVELAIRGISDRPSLVVAEVAALLLAPLALLLTTPPRRDQ